MKMKFFKSDALIQIENTNDFPVPRIGEQIFLNGNNMFFPAVVRNIIYDFRSYDDGEIPCIDIHVK